MGFSAVSQRRQRAGRGRNAKGSPRCGNDIPVERAGRLAVGGEAQSDVEQRECHEADGRCDGKSLVFVRSLHGDGRGRHQKPNERRPPNVTERASVG